jgi:hypothetical protein
MTEQHLDTHPPPAANPFASNAKGMTMTRKRFEYVRMTGEEFTADLKAIGMPVTAFARITGSIADRVQKWADGQEDIPTWVPILTAIFKNVPGALPEARQAAAERILRDLNDPKGREFPYLEKEEDNDE